MKTRVERKVIFKIMGINITFAILLFVLIYINKTFIRPTYNNTHFIQMLTGSFPNFIAGLLMCLCVVTPVLIRKPKFKRIIVYTISLCIMFVLVFDELQSLTASKQYDLNDVIGSVIGVILALFIFEYFYYRQRLAQIRNKKPRISAGFYENKTTKKKDFRIS